MAAFFNVLILLGALQGFIISCLLFFSKKNRPANRILAALILLIALASFNLYGNYVNWFGSPLLGLILGNIVPLVIVMPLGPLIYFYVQSSLNSDFKITKKQRLHFYPVLIDLIPSFTVIIYLSGLLTKLVKHNPAPWGNFIDNYNVYADIPRWLSVTIYVWLSHKYLMAYKASHGAKLTGKVVNFKWLQQFIYAFIVFQAIWLLYLVPYVIPKYTGWMLDTFDWYPIYIPMAILIYWLGIKGYLMSAYESQKKAASPATELSEEIILQTKDALLKAMEADRLFLNPELSVLLLSQQIAIPQKTISAVLNQHLQKSFNEFINGYRVETFKQKIGQPDTRHLTIAGVAATCGFNSQATFQRTFKEITGMSPSAYLKTAVKTA